TEVSRSAIARIWTGTGGAVIILDPHASGALTMSGEAVLDSGNGSVLVNSDSASAVKGTKGIIDSPELNVVGGVSSSGTFQWTGDLNLGADPIPDPLAYLPQPNPAGAPSRGTVKIGSSTRVALQPG